MNALHDTKPLNCINDNGKRMDNFKNQIIIKIILIASLIIEIASIII